MGDAGFIKDIRVTPREVADDDLRAGDERNDVIDEHAVFPDVVPPLTHPAACLTYGLQRAPYRVKLSLKRHHHRDPIGFRRSDWQRECSWPREPEEVCLEQHLVEVGRV